MTYRYKALRQGKVLLTITVVGLKSMEQALTLCKEEFAERFPKQSASHLIYVIEQED